VKESLGALYRHQMFFPGFLGMFINPFYFARKGLGKAMKNYASRMSGDLLDVGCGIKPYQSIFSVASYVGLDIDSENTRRRGAADFFYDGTVFPFRDESFDSILCNQVLEHVFNPDEFLAEVRRVLKPGGYLLLTVPFVWDEHEQPLDYARYSSFGLHSLLKKAGFNVLEHKKLGADASIIFQLINAYLYKIILRWPRPLQLLITVTFVAFFNVMGILARLLLPGNPDLFLDNVVFAEKIY
jgi:SAM-dependent methyltransferase